MIPFGRRAVKTSDEIAMEELKKGFHAGFINWAKGFKIMRKHFKFVRYH